MRDESPVPAAQAKEGLHLILCLWAWAATDGLDRVHLWFNLASSKPITQVLPLLFDLLTLGRIQCQADLLDLSWNLLQIIQLPLPDGAEDDHIIQVGSTAVLTPLQDLVHQSREGRGAGAPLRPKDITVNREWSTGVQKRADSMLPGAAATSP